jgi:negative regulator of sigma E activity
LKAPEPNQALSQPFWAEHRKLWTATAVGLVGLIVLAVIISMLKRINQEREMSKE